MSAPNTEQLAAIEAPGVVFLSAGAGTGKTTVLVERFVRAVCDRGLSVESLLAITYTERAAAELRGRIRARLAELGREDLARDLDAAWISTIHGFCHRLLRAHAFAAGLDPRFRVLDESQGRVLRSESFEEALTDFCAGGRADRLGLLAIYGKIGLRRMLTGVHETLRSAGRPLELGSGQGSSVDEAGRVLREAGQCLLDDPASGSGPRERIERLLDLLRRSPQADLLLDLSDFGVRGERYASYEAARRTLERAALDRLAARDRELLQELLERFAESYRAAKNRESALDFEDLQLLARDLLRDNPSIRERESWHFRSIMVDEFQDTNRLQCELLDLLSRPSPAAASAGRSPATPPPDAAERRDPFQARVPDTVPSGLPPSAAPEERESNARPSAAASAGRSPATPPDSGQEHHHEPELFFVGDEFQSIYGFRHADVEVFRERRAELGGVLALTENYRSRPEVLGVINHLFSSDFGESFQPLSAAGRFADPLFAPAVELLVTDKESYSGTAVHWRRAEARHIARRVRELVDASEAEPGEVVLLFAAGTDAEVYEDELRAADLPTHRATGRGYFGQQQVVDLLAYLRLLHNRYDDQALVTVLASPFVGVSNDGLVLLRRAAPRRPIFTGLERGMPEGVSSRDERLFRAFLQRYERLAAATGELPLERLCERIITEHDYDLAVLARWDGRRRYANMRKLARLARSYEELRGPDIEGFVRFVREQDAIGARELEAVAEEEGSDAVRLLTIHAAKGLEFKVVFVADAGRDARGPGADEILCLPDGRFGFRVVDPASGRRRGAFDYEAVKSAGRRAEDEERRRLYYVAMTRAVDRLIVSGAYDRTRAADDTTPIGWVLQRLQAAELNAGETAFELERDGARLLLRVDRFSPEGTPVASPSDEGAQLSLFPAGDPGALPPSAPALPALQPIAEPPVHRIRRLSYSALALFEHCSYRFYAERLAGLAPIEARQRGGMEGLAATEVGDAVHAALERLDPNEPRAPSRDELTGVVRGRYADVSEEELDRVAAFVQAYLDSDLAARVAGLAGARPERPFAFEHDGVLLHGRIDVLAVADDRAFVLDFKTNALAEASPEEIVERDYRLQRLVYALACFRAGVREVEVVYHFLERRDAIVSTTFTREDLSALEAELSAAITRIQAGEFRPTPSEFVCADCPALDVVCAGPRLRGAARSQEPVLAVAG